MQKVGARALSFRTGLAVFAFLGFLSTANAACPDDDAGCTANDPPATQDDEDETETSGSENACPYMSYMLPSEACMNSLHDELACSACPKTK